MKKISYNSLEKVLTPKEMKNITGGSCMVKCASNGLYHYLECWDILDCESQCYAKCGDSGWYTTCF